MELSVQITKVVSGVFDMCMHQDSMCSWTELLAAFTVLNVVLHGSMSSSVHPPLPPSFHC